MDASHGKLWILTNDEHVNFRLAEATPERPGEWRTVIAGSDRVYLRHVAAFRDHLALTERVDGLDQIRLRSYDGTERRIPFAEASYTVGLGANPEYAPDSYRLSYSSMVTPPTTYAYHFRDGSLEALKVQRIPSGYDPANYVTERIMVPTRDGRQLPVSIVYRARLRAQRRAAGSSSTLMALMASPRRPPSAPTASACSIAAMPSPSPISAAATISAINGISTASSSGGPTPSTISSMPRAA